MLLKVFNLYFHFKWPSFPTYPHICYRLLQWDSSWWAPETNAICWLIYKLWYTTRSLLRHWNTGFRNLAAFRTQFGGHCLGFGRLAVSCQTFGPSAAVRRTGLWREELVRKHAYYRSQLYLLERHFIVAPKEHKHVGYNCDHCLKSSHEWKLSSNLVKTVRHMGAFP